METNLLNPNVLERSFQKLLNYFAWALGTGKLIVKEADNAKTINNLNIEDILLQFKSDTTVRVSDLGQYEVRDLEFMDLTNIKLMSIYIVDYGEIDISSLQYKVDSNNIKTIDIPDNFLMEFIHYPIIISWIDINDLNN